MLGFKDERIPDDIFAVQSQKRNGPASVLFLTADKTEDLEFFYPYYRFIEEGFTVDVATPDGGAFEGKNGTGLKQTKKITEVNATQYDLLYIPGGKAPATLKKDDNAVALVQAYVATGKPVASLCHGPQLLAEANVIQGRKIAAWPEVENEVNEAGATYVNQETCVDGQFITARWPGDLPAQLAETLRVLKQQSKAQQKSAA